MDEDLFVFWLANHWKIFRIRQVRDSLQGDRPRAILKWALENLQGPKDTLTAEYTLFEKQYGTMDNIETILLAKRKDQYEAIVKETPFDYDAWFDYLKMLEQQNRPSEVVEAYERAVLNVPPSQEKRFWRR